MKLRSERRNAKNISLASREYGDLEKEYDQINLTLFLAKVFETDLVIVQMKEKIDKQRKL